MSEQKQAEAKTVTKTSEKRTITVVSTRGEKKKIEIENGIEWLALEGRLGKEGYSLSNMKVVEGVNKHTLEHPKAVVPDGDFNLFLMPLKSKSGAMSRAEINSAIKSHIERDGDRASNYFKDDKSSYTQVSSAKLSELLEGYSGNNGTDGGKTKKKVSKEKAEAISQVVENIKNSKNKEELYAEVNRMSFDDKMFLVISLLQDIRDAGVTTPSNNLVEEKAVEVKQPKEKSAEEIAKEKADEEEKERKRQEDEKEKEENARLEREQEELMGGFDDVKR